MHQKDRALRLLRPGFIEMEVRVPDTNPPAPDSLPGKVVTNDLMKKRNNHGQKGNFSVSQSLVMSSQKNNPLQGPYI